MKKLILALGLGLLSAASAALGGEQKVIITFPYQDLSFKKLMGYNQVRMKGLLSTNQAGRPELPLASVTISIPAGMEAVGMQVVSADKKVIPGNFKIYPAQPPQPISRRPGGFVPPDSTIYSSPQPYPGRIAELTGCGSLGGYKLAKLLIYPLQYIPAKGSLTLYTKLELSLDLIPSRPSLSVRGRSQEAQALYEQIVKDLVINPLEIPPPTNQVYLHFEGFEYLIVTSSALAPEFQQLADWKTEKGISATIRTISWIRDNYWGNDDAEKLRNYLRIAYQDSGLVWVLLGGDVEVVPCRKAWVSAGGYADTLPCDQYYSDLDGSWDANGNGLFGELDDEVDMYPDIFVGRAPVNTSLEAETFVGKVLEYEKNPPLDYQLKMLFLAGTLWDEPDYPYTPGGEAKDYISYFVPSSFSITRLYDDHDHHDLSPAAALAAMNEGYHIINHNDHANWNVLRMGEQGGIFNQDMDTLSNLRRWSIFYSGGCISGAFDYSDCIGEHFINNPNGGGVGYIGNSRYGFGTPGDPGAGPSDQYDFEFFASLFTGHYHLGVTHAESKSRLVPVTATDPYLRWCQYELNLLGDPEMPVWTNTPESLTVAYSQTIPLMPCTLSVEVSSSQGPVYKAMVSLVQAGELIQIGYTDHSGNLPLQFSPLQAGSLLITVAAHNYLPFQGKIDVVPAGPFVYCQGYDIDDDTLGESWGNGDGTLNPGEKVELKLTAKNPGDEEAIGVWGKLSAIEPGVTVFDSLIDWGDIAAGSLAVSPTPFLFQVALACTNQQVLSFTLEFSDQADHIWEEGLDFKVFSPSLFLKGTAIEDTGGNGNGAFEPGETVNLILTLENKGSAEATGLSAILRINTPHITILDSVSSFESIPIWRWGDNSSQPFVLQADAQQPEDVEIPITLYLQTTDGWGDTIDLPLRIGLPRYEWADHDVGNLIFTVTGYGAFGFNSPDGRGHGFTYPKDGENYLYYGALIAGTSPDYLVDRFYNPSGGVDMDWMTTAEPDGRLKMGNLIYSDQDGWAEYDDSGHPLAKGLTIIQNSWAWVDSPYNDFVILDYTLFNQGESNIEGLYVGQFMDYDLVDPLSNEGMVDEDRRLVYMYYAPETPIMGVKLLYPKSPANLSLIDHYSYIYPETEPSEQTKFQFLNGTLHDSSSTRTYDWSAVASAGPFSLSPGDSQKVAFAVLAGWDLEDLDFNADQAQALYDSLVSGVVERREVQLPTSYNLYPNYPNPFNPATKITYSLPKPSKVTLTIYNLLGQKVASLVDGNEKPGRRSVRWNARGLGSGIYFCRLKAGGYTKTIKMVLLK